MQVCPWIEGDRQGRNEGRKEERGEEEKREKVKEGEGEKVEERGRLHEAKTKDWTQPD